MKQYLGGGVYADTDVDGVVLTTEDGIGATHTIYIEPAVIQALMIYLRGERMKRKTIEEFCRTELKLNSDTITNDVMFRVIVEAIERWEECQDAKTWLP